MGSLVAVELCLLFAPAPSRLPNQRRTLRPVHCNASERRALFNRIAPVYDSVRRPYHSIIFFIYFQVFNLTSKNICG